ncbi:hypothetical protein Ancab_034182 [Ancistrocladus abbreviatus]
MVKKMSTSSNWSWTVGQFMLITMIILVAKTVSAVTCQEVISAMAPCSGYLKGKDPPPPSEACCSSCRNLLQQSQTKEERRALCQCLKETGPKVGVVPERIKQLTEHCKLQLPFPTTPEFDCDK